MSKQQLAEAFNKVHERGDKAFVPYIMAGDGGGVSNLSSQIDFLEKSGATVIELGIPFTDPVADGPTIQEAGKRALANGTTLTNIIAELKRTKQTRHIPIVLMTYMNPIFSFGIEAFAQSCQQAGVSGLIIPDLPLEEAAMMKPQLKAYDLAHIQLVSLTTPQQRLKEIAIRTEGFLYAVTVTGTTGARSTFHSQVGDYLQRLKDMSHVPVLAGFGVSTAKHVQELSSHCDGVVVGSKIVQLFHEKKYREMEQLINAAKQGKQANEIPIYE